MGYKKQSAANSNKIKFSSSVYYRGLILYCLMFKWWWILFSFFIISSLYCSQTDKRQAARKTEKQCELFCRKPMAQKIKRAVCFSKTLEIILLVFVFLTFNFLLLSSVEQKLAQNLTVRDEFSSEKRGKRHNLLIENSLQSESQQLITFEEDGRFGNLLLETATLLLIGRKLNKQVNLLPQVAQKLNSYFSSLPAESIDYTQVNCNYFHNIKCDTFICFWRGWKVFCGEKHSLLTLHNLMFS